MAAVAAAAMVSGNAAAAIISSKRGFADVNANYSNLQATGAGWYYTWGTGAANPGGFDARHHPMFWSAPSQTTINNVKSRNPEYVLGFNEPERTDQANMTVAQAISSWTTISNSFAGTATKLVSPAVADTGGAAGGQAWLASFMSQARSANLKVDAVAFHWYGVSTPDNPAGAASSFLSRVASYHNSYSLPVFITEFAIHDWGGNYTDAQITEANRQFLNIVIPELERRDYVAGYSWYHWFSDARLYSGNPPAPTPMAHSYVGAVGPGQVADIGGQDLGQHAAYLTGGELTMTGATAGTVRYINALADTSDVSGSMDWGLSSSSNWVRIQGGATLRKTGSNRITLSAGTVTNNGVLEVAQGSLRLGIPVAGTGLIHISSTGGATGSTARLELTGGVAVASPITFAQRNDPSGSDGIRNVSGNNTLSGPITIVVGGNAARIQSDAGLLTLSGGISTTATSARNLYLQGAGAGLVSGAISDNPTSAAGLINLHKQGAGTWTLGGANTYAGSTTVSAGTLSVSSDSNLGAATAALNINGGGMVLFAAPMTSSRPIVIGNGGGNVDVPSGTVSLQGNLSIRAAAALIKTGPATLRISGPQVHEVNANLVASGGTINLASNAGAAASASAAAVANLSLNVSGNNAAVILDASQDLRNLTIPYGNPGNQSLDLHSPSTSGAFNGLRIYSADLDAAKASLWAAIRNANRAGAPNPLDGIFDSGRAAHAAAGIGIAQINDAHGEEHVQVRLARIGDLNLDGMVTISDFIDLASHFNNSAVTWREGDLNYDGAVTISDFIDLAANFNTSYSGESFPISPEDQQSLWSFAALHGGSAVPEPASSLFIVLATLVLARRRP